MKMFFSSPAGISVWPVDWMSSISWRGMASACMKLVLGAPAGDAGSGLGGEQETCCFRLVCYRGVPPGGRRATNKIMELATKESWKAQVQEGKGFLRG
jgi:hypothetical protein